MKPTELHPKVAMLPLLLLTVLFFPCQAYVNQSYTTSLSRSFPEAPVPRYHHILSAPGALLHRDKQLRREGSHLAEGLKELKSLVEVFQDFRYFQLSSGDGLFNAGGDVFLGDPDLTMQTALTSLRSLSDSGVTSDKCVNDTGHLLVSMVERQGWALKFLDATGKPGPGVSKVRVNFVGDYDLCRSLVAPPSNETDGFTGNYVTLKAFVGPPSTNPFTMLVVKWGVCMPNTCSDTENTLFLAQALQAAGLNKTLTVTQAESHTDERNASGFTIAAITIVVVIGLLMLAGTVYDVIFVQLPLWRVRWAAERTLMTNEDAVITRVDDDDPLLGKGLLPPAPSDTAKGKLSQVLLAFSVYTNGSKVLNTSQAPGSISCLHGIRFLSMSWVILGHTLFFSVGDSENVADEIPKLTQRWTFDGIANAFVSVDTFFTLSGILTVYVTLKEMKKRGWNINWALFYFHRFWRLTPPYILALVLVMGLQQYFGQGPLWPSVQPGDRETCEKYWWTNLLYIQNLVHREQQCFSHAWYLANDMQFFWISPLMLIPLCFNKWLGLFVSSLFLLACWVTTGSLSAIRQWPTNILTVNSPGWPTFFTDYYVAPWCRIGPFIVGIMTGYLLAHRPKGVFRMSRITALLGWVIAAVVALAVLYGLRGEISGKAVLSVRVAALYNAVSRSAWGASVCWVVVACAAGWGGFVNRFLSWSPFVVLGRLSYMAYLIHPCLLYTFFQNQRTLFFITPVNIAMTFLGILFVSYVAAFGLMLGLESPMIGLEKVLLPRHRKD